MKLLIAFLVMSNISVAEDYIQASVRVNEGTRTSSGTIIRVEDSQIWVLSTGHMKELNHTVEAFFYDDQRCEMPLVGKGVVVFLVNGGDEFGVDFSLIKVKFENVDHKRFSFTPLAPESVNSVCVSVGCDFGNDPCKFDTKIVSVENDITIITPMRINRGRSGGGLFCDGKLVGICWGGTVFRDDQGLYQGKFTRSSTILSLLKTSGFMRE